PRRCRAKPSRRSSLCRTRGDAPGADDRGGWQADRGEETLAGGTDTDLSGPGQGVGSYPAQLPVGDRGACTGRCPRGRGPHAIVGAERPARRYTPTLREPETGTC